MAGEYLGNSVAHGACSNHANLFYFHAHTPPGKQRSLPFTLRDARRNFRLALGFELFVERGRQTGLRATGNPAPTEVLYETEASISPARGRSSCRLSRVRGCPESLLRPRRLPLRS